MSYTFVNVKQFKRGAKWPDGEPRMCVRCGYEGGRRRRAVVVADLKYTGSKYRLPVAYCDKHIPDMDSGVEPAAFIELATQPDVEGGDTDG